MAENTFAALVSHEIMSEFGVITASTTQAVRFCPRRLSLHNMMLPHGPDRRRSITQQGELKP